ncbi:MAG: HYR domain-containing protein [Ilumatobacteraceae bacterium]|nr:HYR domain-containing protein [Ilumatobacteraceae bacterium]
MKSRIVSLATAFVVAGSLIGGLDYGSAFAEANGAPVVTSGAVTVPYENVYTVHFTASDPEGAALTIVTPPVNEDWISCDAGPATDFTCDYSSSRYYGPAPLPTEPFQRTISYSVTDGTTTSTGVWTVTVLPPPVMEIVGHPTVTEGGQATLQLKLSSNAYGSLLIPMHTTAVASPGGSVISTSDLMVEVADGQTTADIVIPTVDDAIVEPTEYFSVSVNAADAIPYRFADGGNVVTVLDNDGTPSGDTTPPVVSTHRNVIVERGGTRPAWVPYSPPSAADAVDGALSSVCNPPPMSSMPKGLTAVTCSATDAAGNTASSTFKVTVRGQKSGGSAKIIGGGDRQCLTPGQSMWIEAEGFSPNATVSIQLQASSLEVVPLTTASADKKGRVRQLVKIPAATPGEADVVVVGAAGNDDLVRMLPVKVANTRHQYGGRILGFMRSCQCD